MSNEEEETGNFSCEVCFEPATEPVVTKCGHFFCWSCLNQWLDKGGNDSCPVCKGRVDKHSKTDIIPVFGKGKKSAAHNRARAQQAADAAAHRSHNSGRSHSSTEGGHGNSNRPTGNREEGPSRSYTEADDANQYFQGGFVGFPRGMFFCVIPMMSSFGSGSFWVCMPFFLLMSYFGYRRTMEAIRSNPSIVFVFLVAMWFLMTMMSDDSSSYYDYWDSSSGAPAPPQQQQQQQRQAARGTGRSTNEAGVDHVTRR